MHTQFDFNETVSIVLIEDNATDIMMIREAFKELGVTNPLNICQNGAHAIDFLTSMDEPPGLIILDLNLPRVGGHNVLEAIKATPALCLIPVVIFTSSRSRQDIARAYQLQANCYITKPMDYHKFSQAIRTIREFWLGLVTLPQGVT